MRVALYQARTGIDPADNGAALLTACRTAAEGGAAMLFTPEMSGLLDRDSRRADRHVTSEADDAVLRLACSAARQHGLWLHLGSLALRDGGEKLVNRGFVIDKLGAIRSRYDKMHMFDVDLPTGETWRESARYDAGTKTVVADTPIGCLGLSICYDLRFPELYARLVNDGARILAVPAAFTVPTGRAHWHVLLRARAIECGAFVIAAAQCGRHADGRETFGHSLVVDPWGEPLLDMEDAEDEVGFADIDLAAVDRARAAIPAWRDRRLLVGAEVAG